MSKRYGFLPSYYFEDNTDGKLVASAGKPLRDCKIYGESIQGAIPAPDAPVEIESCGEKYEILVDETGENLFPFTEGAVTTAGVTFTAKDGAITVSYDGTGAGYGVISAITFAKLANYTNNAVISQSNSILLKAGTYEFQAEGGIVGISRICLIIGNMGTSGASGDPKAKTYVPGAVITLTEDQYCTPVYVCNSDFTVNVQTITNITLKKKVIEYKYRLPIKSYGKNIADPMQIHRFVSRMNAVGGPNHTSDGNVTILTDDNGREILKFTGAAGYQHPNAALLRTLFTGIFKPNTRYTISFDFYKSKAITAMNMKVFYTDGTSANFAGAGGVANQIYSYKWTTAANKTIDRISTDYHDGATFIYLDTLQIEEGTTKTDYEECIGTQYIYLDEPLRKVLEPPTAYTNIVDIDYILENNPTDTTSLERVTYQDRDCLSLNLGNKANNLRIMQGKFKENTAYTIRASIASNKATGSIFIKYTDGFTHEIRTQHSIPDIVANEFREIVFFTRKGKTVDHIHGSWQGGETLYIDINKFTIIEGICKTPYFPQKSTIYRMPIYSNSKNIANTLDVYNYARNINTVHGTSTDSNFIGIDKDGREFLNNWASTGYGKDGYAEAKILFSYAFKEKTQYTLSFDCTMSANNTNLVFRYTDGTYSNMSREDSDASTVYSLSFTSSINKTLKDICLSYSSGSCYIYLDTIQLEEGTVKTDYVPYVLREIYTDQLLDTVKYSDYLDFKNKKIIRCIDKQVFTGEENWAFSGTTRETNFFELEDAVEKSPAYPTLLLSNYFTSRDFEPTTMVAGNMAFEAYLEPLTEIINHTTRKLYVGVSNCSTVEEFKEWLAELNESGNPVCVLYVMKTPTEIIIELPEICTGKGDSRVIVDPTISPSQTVYQYYRDNE